MNIKKLVLTIAAASTLGAPVFAETVVKKNEAAETVVKKNEANVEGSSILTPTNMVGGAVAAVATGAGIWAGLELKKALERAKHREGGVAVSPRRVKVLRAIVATSVAVAGVSLATLFTLHLAGNKSADMTTKFGKFIDGLKAEDLTLQGKDKVLEANEKKAAGIIGVSVDAFKKMPVEHLKALLKMHPELCNLYTKDGKVGDTTAPATSAWLSLAGVTKVKSMTKEEVKARTEKIAKLAKELGKLEVTKDAKKNAPVVKAKADYAKSDAAKALATKVTEAEAKVTEAKAVKVKEDLTQAVTSAEKALADVNKLVAIADDGDEAEAESKFKQATIDTKKADAEKAVTEAKKAVTTAKDELAAAVTAAEKAVTEAKAELTTAEEAAVKTVKALSTATAFAKTADKTAAKKAAGDAVNKGIADAKKAHDDADKAGAEFVKAVEWVLANPANAA